MVSNCKNKQHTNVQKRIFSKNHNYRYIKFFVREKEKIIEIIDKKINTKNDNSRRTYTTETSKTNYTVLRGKMIL